MTVPADKFAAMNWPLERLGARAVVYAGQGTKDHVRAAIQLASKAFDQRTVYTHLGWRQIGGEWCYLHAGGAIGPVGPVPGVDVSVAGVLENYLLPDPPETEELRECIRRSLELRLLAPRHITCCLEAATFRTVLGGNCDLTVFLAGATGNGKSELAARQQQHFGAAMDRLNLPGNWASTGNSLEAIAFAAKDSLFSIDDFAPRGNQHDVARHHQLADRVIRAQRNKSGRHRLGADGSQRPTKKPRCVILGTGEDVPNGQSLRASMMILELPADSLDWERLTECQRLGADGVYAKTMAGFIQWAAARYDRFQTELPRRFARHRDTVAASQQHHRTPELAANLFVGAQYFLSFASQVGAITFEERVDYLQESLDGLRDAMNAQGSHLHSADPARRFLEIISSALASGAAHLVSIEGGQPKMAAMFGWRQQRTGSGTLWVPGGEQIGWLGAQREIYLEPESAFRLAQEHGRYGEPVSVGQKTLHRRLHEGGFLAAVDEANQRLIVRVMLNRVRRHVLHLRDGLL